MKTASALVLASILAFGTTGVHAQSVFESLTSESTPSKSNFLTPIEALSRTTTSFNVVTVSPSDARFLGFDTNVEAVRARIQQNKFAANFLTASGFTVDQVVGARAYNRNSVTLFVVG